MNSNGRRDIEEKGLIWKLPQIKLKDLGKVGPAFGAGIGCGVGVGVGLVGGIGIGPGFPGLQFGAGFGAGCGIGVGFGYGLGKGVAHDDYRRYSNVGNSDVLGALVDELAVNTRKIIEVTSREIEKWRNS